MHFMQLNTRVSRVLKWNYGALTPFLWNKF